MAGGDAVGPEDVSVREVADDLPRLVVVLGHLPARGPRVPSDDVGGDRFGPVEIEPLTRRLEGGHRRLGEVHIGVLAAVARDARPVAAEFLGRGARLSLPEAGRKHLGHVGDQPVGIRVADELGARRGEQHEGVAVGLLPVVAPDAPHVAAVGGVAMRVPQEIHAVVDEAVGPGAPHQPGDGEAVNGTRGDVDLAHRLGSRPAGIVEGEEPAFRVEARRLEEIEEIGRLLDQPAAVIRQRHPIRGGHGFTCHERLRKRQ